MRKFFNLLVTTVLAVVMTLSLTGSAKAATTTVNLGVAGGFVILSDTGITDSPTSTITGNIGVSPTTGASITGIVQAQVTGTIFAVDGAGPAGSTNNPTILTTAKNDLTAAYTDAANRTVTQTIVSELGGQTLTSGVYNSADTKFGITAGQGVLTLNGQGDPNAVFIFEAAADDASSLTVGPGSQVVLENSASACNVFWRVNGATIDTTAIFKGNILSHTAITVKNGANIEGRLLAETANVTLINDTVTVSTCAAAYNSIFTSALTPAALPDTGNVKVGSSTTWYVILPAVGIILLAILFFVIKKKKEI